MTDILEVELEGRGVYLARWKTKDGNRVMFCLDSSGRHVGHLEIEGIVTYEVAERVLTSKLDAADPKPALRLVKDERPAIPAYKPSATVVLALHGLIRRRTP